MTYCTVRGLRGQTYVRGCLTSRVAVLASGTTAGDDGHAQVPGQAAPAACLPAARVPATTVARRRPGMTISA